MVDNEGSGQTAIHRRWHRLGCWIWLRIVVLVLVLSVLVAYSVEVWRCSSFEPTGDALYDRYAQAVISSQKWVLFHGGKHHPTYLPDSLLAKWESDFGSDPRYWQLRYFCARHKGGSMEEWIPNTSPLKGVPKSYLIRSWDGEPTDIEDNAWRHLQSGVDHGAADWMTLWILERKPTRIGWNSNYPEVVAIEKLDIDILEKRRLMIELNRKQEQAELARLTAIIDADPNQAWPYFWRAKYWFNYGESELALADLKAGNAAPNNEIVRSFPVNFLIERMDNSDHLGSNVLAGAIFEEDSSNVRTNWLKWKNGYGEALAMVALGGDTTIIQELHLAACRLGVAKYNGKWEPVVASNIDSWLAHTLLTSYGQDLTYRQRLAMMRIYKRTQAVQNYHWSRSDVIKQNLINYPRLLAFEKKSNISKVWIQHTMLSSPDNNYLHLEMFLQQIAPTRYYKRALWVRQQQQIGVHEVKQTFGRLTLVNLTTLEWPEEWGTPY